VSYFAAALARRGSRWTGDEIDLSEVEDLDGVVDVMGQAAGDDAELVLMVFEENDEWFGIVRVDDADSDPRVFVSDGRVIETSAVGAILGEAAAVQEDDDEDLDADESADDEDDDEPGTAGDPIGDLDIVSDLGSSRDRLLRLCAEEGQLPADILSAICESAGCLDALEQLRDT
jgi:putative tRNA adenosine deaminase-associated protein